MSHIYIIRAVSSDPWIGTIRSWVVLANSEGAARDKFLSNVPVGEFGDFYLDIEDRGERK